VAGAVLAAGAVVLTGLSATPLILVLWWTLAGASASMINVALQNLTVRAVPANRGGALSAVSAFRFSGAALAPLCLLPIYADHPRAAFFAAGAALLLVAVVLVILPRSEASADQRPRQDPPDLAAQSNNRIDGNPWRRL
jgi:MFS family permease